MMPPEINAEVKAYDRYEAAKEVALAKGLAIVVPGPRELFLDIDDPEQFKRYQAMVMKLRESLPIAGVVVRPSPSLHPHHFHILVTLKRDLKDDFERILLQSLLGSDPVREMLSWQRAMRGDKVPTLFFERPA